jgi:hypothetical protein
MFSGERLSPVGVYEAAELRPVTEIEEKANLDARGTQVVQQLDVVTGFEQPPGFELEDEC